MYTYSGRQDWCHRWSRTRNSGISHESHWHKM